MKFFFQLVYRILLYVFLHRRIFFRDSASRQIQAIIITYFAYDLHLIRTLLISNKCTFNIQYLYLIRYGTIDYNTVNYDRVNIFIVMSLYGPFRNNICEFASKMLRITYTAWAFIKIVSIPDEE